jgi:hypothetical protein
MYIVVFSKHYSHVLQITKIMVGCGMTFATMTMHVTGGNKQQVFIHYAII